MAWAFFFSVLTEIHWICILCSVHLIGYDFIRIVSLFAIALVDIQILFFLYYIRLYLKRVPNFDHDFLGTFLTIWNVFIPVIFGYFQSYGSTTLVGIIQGYEPVPIILGFTLVFLILVTLVHGAYDNFFAKNSTVPQPIFIVENHQNQPIALNNVAFNPTLMNLKTSILILLPVSLCFLSVLVVYYFLNNLDFSEFSLEGFVEYFLRIYACFVSPLVFGAANKNIRSYAMKLMK